MLQPLYALVLLQVLEEVMVEAGDMAVGLPLTAQAAVEEVLVDTLAVGVIVVLVKALSRIAEIYHSPKRVKPVEVAVVQQKRVLLYRALNTARHQVAQGLPQVEEAAV